jgi:DNA invertase Pin-like site-specific DNA recombinase
MIMGRKLGYARVSTIDQSLDLQVDALIDQGVEERDIFKEKLTGSRKDRPELDKLLQYAKPGDTIVVWKLDRIGRSLKHLIDIMEHLENQGIQFISINDQIDTTTATGKLIFHMMAALSQFEREMIIERTKAGLKAARARGKLGGRPTKDTNSIELALKMYDDKYPIEQIVKATGVSKTSLYRYLNKREEEQIG